MAEFYINKSYSPPTKTDTESETLFPDAQSLQQEMDTYRSLYPFTLDHFQQYSLQGILQQKNVLVCVPTGSGKTLVAQLGIEKTIREDKKIIYTSPIKTLSNQKFLEFRQRYPDSTVGIVTGDIKLNPDAQIIIMTTEILRNLLNRKEDIGDSTDKLHEMIDVSNDVGLIIFDEVHYINDIDRGTVWEECFIMMPPSIQLVLLSATIQNSKEKN